MQRASYSIARQPPLQQALADPAPAYGSKGRKERSLHDALMRRKTDVGSQVRSGLAEKAGLFNGSRLPGTGQVGNVPLSALAQHVNSGDNSTRQREGTTLLSTAPRPTRKIVTSGPQLRPDPATVIFLDVDGVLHSLYGSDFFVESSMRAFEQIVLTSNATVVLSSTWRLKPHATAQVHSILRKRGLTGIADRTPDFSGRGIVRREDEVVDWLRRHPEVEHWIAIDDMDLAHPLSPLHTVMKAHFLKTDSNCGLMRSIHVEKALKLLRNPRGSLEEPSQPSGGEKSRSSEPSSGQHQQRR
jgi:hypothetical protein